MKKLLLILAVLAIGATTTASAQKLRVMSYNVKMVADWMVSRISNDAESSFVMRTPML